MLDVLLIHPGAVHGIAGGHPVYGDLGADLIAVEQPTWLRMQAGWLRDNGYSIAIIDQEAERITDAEVAERAVALAPLLVSIVVAGHQPSASAQQMVCASSVARAIKERRHGVQIIMTGNNPSAVPVKTLKEEQIDFVADGEGPITLARLVDRLKEGRLFDFSDVPGLVWWDVNNLNPVQNPRAPLIPIDELHGDVWDLLPMGRYKSHNWHRLDDLSKRQPYASIYATLGCPYACSFCMINVFQHTNRYRRRDPMKVVDQIEHLNKEYGVESLKFADELFVLTPEFYGAVCEEMIRRGLGEKIRFWSYARCDTVREDKLDLLYRAGCRWLALGIESASPEVRDGASKRMRNDDIVGVVNQIRAAGINTIGNFIFGLRNDTMETMQATLDLALECLPEWANFYVAQAYPGSKLYDEAIAKGWKLPQTYAGFSQHNSWTRNLDTEHVSAKEVLAFRDAAFNAYFTNPKYLEFVKTKFGEETLAHVRNMVKYKLHRKLLTGEIN